MGRTLVIEHGVTVTDVGGVEPTEGAVVDNAGTWNLSSQGLAVSGGFLRHVPTTTQLPISKRKEEAHDVQEQIQEEM